jgi:selenocysteine-specific elongation factor
MTGTVLSGMVKVGDTIELPNLKQEKKVKSMQMFRKPVTVAK